MADNKSRNTSTLDARQESHFSAELIEDRTFLLASVVDSSDDAIITKTSKGIITSWNSGAEKIYGFSAREAIGKPISILTPPGYADEVPGILERIQQGESIRHYETVRRRKDEQIINVSVSISPVRDKHGRLIGASTIARDITAEVAARKESEEKLAAASQYARSLIESSLDPLVTISPDGKITDVNEATIKVTGVLREQLIGTDFSNYFTQPEKAREGYQQVFAKGFVTDYPLTIRHRDGRLTDVLYNASVYRDAQGEVLGVFDADKVYLTLWRHWSKEGDRLARRQFELWYPKWRRLREERSLDRLSQDYVLFDMVRGGIPVLPYVIHQIEKGDNSLLHAVGFVREGGAVSGSSQRLPHGNADRAACLDWWQENKTKWLIFDSNEPGSGR